MRIQSLNSLTRVMAFSAFVAMSSRSGAQATTPLYDNAPTYAGFQLPHVAGSLRYSVTASGFDRFGSTQLGNGLGGGFSGNMGYISRSTAHPFSMVYSGGFGFGDGADSSQIFQSLSASQVLQAKRWTFLISDSVSYLPGTPLVGLSGVAGIGDLGAAPVQTGVVEGPQSAYAARVTNTAALSAQRSLTGRTSVTAAGTYGIIRFTANNPGLELNSESGTLSLNHVLSPRTNVGGSYFISRTTYPQNSVNFQSQGANAFLSHVWSARLSSSFSGGPVFTTTPGTPTRTGVNYSAGLAYIQGINQYSLYASQSLDSGSGVTTESQVQSAGGSVSRRLTRFSNGAVSTGYSRSTTLPSLIAPSGSFDTISASAQVSQSISRVLSAYASYTFSHQTSASSVYTVNALQGSSQTLGFGLTYSPRAITLGRQ